MTASHIQQALPVSDTTDKTDFSLVTNEEFLVAIHGGSLTADRPVVTFFPGDPKLTAKKNWIGEGWFPGDTLTDKADCNAYYSLSKHSPNDNGEYSRQKKYFAGLRVIVRDDVGTKAGSESTTIQSKPC